MRVPPRRPASSRRPLRVPPSRRRVPGAPPRAVGAVARGGAWIARRADGGRLLLALVVSLVGIGLAAGGALADVYLHRGVETGSEAPPTRHVTGRDLAINVDLTRFAPEQLDAVATALQSNGFRYVRQSFAWSEIEPARDDFRWERYDAIVEALDKHQIIPVAVLHRSPAWARAPEAATAFDAPPIDAADYERFVGEVARRYGERVPFLQLWDQPNRPDHWGGNAADAGAYFGLLSLGFNAARAANPTATVILAELDAGQAPDERGSDLAFLWGLYEVGAAPFFHVVAIQLNGGERTPFDRRVGASVPSVSRASLFRETMAEAGDAEKPVWATHYGWWSPAEAGGINAATRAAFMVAGIERSRDEWPWMGPLFIAGLIPGETLGGEVDPANALLQANGEATPLLAALDSFASSGVTDAAPTGFLPVEARQFDYEGNWDLQHLGPETYRTTSEVGARVRVVFTGTGIVARMRFSPQAGEVAATLDDAPLNVDLQSFQAVDASIPLAAGLEDTEHELTLTLASPGQLTIGGLIVQREMPLRWPVALLLVSGGGLLFLGLREMASIVAERTGRLQRRRGVDLWPELPRLPDWRPARRA